MLPLFRGVTSAQVRAVEGPLIAAGEPLMQRAAAALADELRSVLTARDGLRRIVALVGSGDNGGDALFAIAALAAQGCPTVIVPLGSRMHEAGLVAALDAGADVLDRPTPERVVRLAGEADLLVDGILGIGAAASPALRSPAREVVAALLPLLAAEPHPIVVAVDLPSGVSPDDGAVPPGPVLPADVTVTFGAVKAGLLMPPASALVGRIRLVDLGYAID